MSDSVPGHRRLHRPAGGWRGSRSSCGWSGAPTSARLRPRRRRRPSASSCRPARSSRSDHSTDMQGCWHPAAKAIKLEIKFPLEPAIMRHDKTLMSPGGEEPGCNAKDAIGEDKGGSDRLSRPRPHRGAGCTTRHTEDIREEIFFKPMFTYPPRARAPGWAGHRPDGCAPWPGRSAWTARGRAGTTFTLTSRRRARP